MTAVSEKQAELPETGPETGIVAISRNGASLARTLADSLAGENTLYLERRWSEAAGAGPGLPSGWAPERVVVFELPLRPALQGWFERHQRLVLFMPVGAAVRLLAPCLQHKGRDPAVVCVDDAGRFAVSALSGHVGGADALAGEVARILGATPVITSASYVMDTLAVDLLGREFGWRIESNAETVTRVSAAVVNGEPVGVFQEAGEPDWWPPDKPLPANVTLYSSWEALAESAGVAALAITDRLLPPGSGAIQQGRMVVYRPRTLVAGMGCRRGVRCDELEALLESEFQRHNLSPRSLAAIATADLKADEPGILELAERYGVPVQCYPAEELNRVFSDRPDGPDVRLTRSEAAHRLLGVWGVAEPAALLAAGSPDLLVTRQKTDRATIAVARRPYPAFPARV